MMAENERQGMLVGAKKCCSLVRWHFAVRAMESSIWPERLCHAVRYFAGINRGSVLWLIGFCQIRPRAPGTALPHAVRHESLWRDKGRDLVGLTLFWRHRRQHLPWDVLPPNPPWSTSGCEHRGDGMFLSTNPVASLGALAGGTCATGWARTPDFCGGLCMHAAVAGLDPSAHNHFLYMAGGGTSLRCFGCATPPCVSVFFVTLNHIRIPPHLSAAPQGFISRSATVPTPSVYRMGGDAGRFAPEIGFKLIFAGLIGFCLAGVGMDLLLLRHIGREEQAFNVKS
jgi:hypothetical protein